jgi:sarcosine oxidase, subunit beta
MTSASGIDRSRGAAVIIVGAGVTGLSAGWWLARSGVDVLVIDRGIAGWEASGRNGGSTAHPFSPLFKEEQRLWPEMDTLLGYPTEYRAHRLRVALTEAQMAHYMRIVGIAERQGAGWDPLDVSALKELVPFVTERAIGGVLCRYGGHANPQRTVQGYAWALQDCGGRLLQHTRVTGILTHGGKIRGVATDRGEFDCESLVLAAGPHIASLAAHVGVRVPLAAARVEMLVTEPVPLLKYGGVDGNGLYGRQTLRGNLTYGGGPRFDLSHEKPREAARRAFSQDCASPGNPQLGGNRRKHAGWPANSMPRQPSGKSGDRDHVECRLRALARERPRGGRSRDAR